jgi:hypothetical protein
VVTSGVHQGGADADHHGPADGVEDGQPAGPVRPQLEPVGPDDQDPRLRVVHGRGEPGPVGRRLERVRARGAEPCGGDGGRGQGQVGHGGLLGFAIPRRWAPPRAPRRGRGSLPAAT